MNLKNKVCSLELSKKLKELGVEQNSLFYYQNNPYNDGKDCIDLMIKETRSKNNENLIINVECENYNNPRYSAFTVCELFDLLPAWIDIKQNEPFNNFYLQLTKRTTEYIKYIARYICDSIPGEEINNPLFKIESTFRVRSPKLADCLAKTLIYLLENGMLKNE